MNKLWGVPLFLTALLLFALLDATSKYLTAYFSVQLVVWARYLTHLVIMLVAIAPGMGRALIVTDEPWLMTLRGLMLVGCSLFVVLALRTLPLAEASALVYLAPVLVVLLAGPLLGEKVRLGNWLAAIAGFGGVLLIARPGSAAPGPGIFYALAGALCNALYQILTRKLSSSEPALRQLFYTALVGTLAMTLIIPWYWTGELPTAGQALLILSLGVTAGCGHFLLIRAFHATPASTLSPFFYLQLVWATLLGWIVFAQLPDLPATLGMLIISASGLSLAWLRRRVG